jgi:hypothetical protein
MVKKSIVYPSYSGLSVRQAQDPEYIDGQLS